MNVLGVVILDDVVVGVRLLVLVMDVVVVVIVGVVVPVHLVRAEEVVREHVLLVLLVVLVDVLLY